MHDYIMPKTDNIISRWSFIKVSSKFQNRLAYVCVDNTTKVYIDEKKKNNCKTYWESFQELIPKLKHKSDIGNLMKTFS